MLRVTPELVGPTGRTNEREQLLNIVEFAIEIGRVLFRQRILESGGAQIRGPSSRGALLRRNRGAATMCLPCRLEDGTWTLAKRLVERPRCHRSETALLA